MGYDKKLCSMQLYYLGNGDYYIREATVSTNDSRRIVTLKVSNDKLL